MENLCGIPHQSWLLFSKAMIWALIWVGLFQCHIAKSQPDKAQDYLQFAFNATEMPAEDYYDYIVVGGGTAGCPLAATLSENYKVLLLERGGVPYAMPNLMRQEGFLPTLLQVDASSSAAQSFISEDGVPNARGRVLGGSSAINAGFYSRADPEFYSKSGMDWDLRLVNQSFEWVESSIVFRPDLKGWQSVMRDGLLEAGVNPYNGFTLNHVSGTKIGGSTFDSSGRRHSSADLLSHARASSIRVVVYASVERVLLATISASDNSRLSAIGVVYRDELGCYHHAMVLDDGEVILAAGAIGSPQILLLSGIGSRPYLSSWGIPVVHHSPYVGQFLYDNPRNGISIIPPFPLEHSLIQVVGITDSGAFLEAASNIVPFSSRTNPMVLRTPPYITVATIMEKISGPLSSGSLRLASTDVKANPVVQFNYFSDPSDLQKCIGGLRKVGEVLRSRSMEDFKFAQFFGDRDFRFVGPTLPADQGDDIVMAEFCRRTVSTIWHYHGGCLVGKVVDRNLQVIGINALRVIDGSILTISPGTNPQATIMMVGRYMGLKLTRERMR